MRASGAHAPGGGRARHREDVDEPDAPRSPLQPGTEAPDFELFSTPNQKADLRHFRGRPVVLVFYPADWSPVCGDQLVLYNELLPEFGNFGAQVLGLSVDGVWCHMAYAQHQKLRFPLLADFEPKGVVARGYGVYRMPDGVAERALFVVDGRGIIRWSYVSPLGVNPGADGILRALEALRAEEKDHGYARDKPGAGAPGRSSSRSHARREVGVRDAPRVR